MKAKAEIAVVLDKKVSINYQSVGLSASIKLVKEIDSDSLEDELTSLKSFLEGWIDKQVVMSAQGLPRLTLEAKKAADDIPL